MSHNDDDRVATLFQVRLPYEPGSFHQFASDLSEAHIETLCIFLASCFDEPEYYRVVNFISVDPDLTRSELPYQFVEEPMYAARPMRTVKQMHDFAKNMARADPPGILTSLLAVPENFYRVNIAVGPEPRHYDEVKQRLREWTGANPEELAIFSFPCPWVAGAVSDVLEPPATLAANVEPVVFLLTGCEQSRRAVLAVKGDVSGRIRDAYRRNGIETFRETDAEESGNVALESKCLTATITQRNNDFLLFIADLLAEGLLARRAFTFPSDRLKADTNFSYFVPRQEEPPEEE